MVIRCRAWLALAHTREPISIQMLLKAHKDLSDLACRAEFANRIAQAVVFEFDQLRQLLD